MKTAIAILLLALCLNAGARQYMGSWNASTNTPKLHDSVGEAGQFYRVFNSAKRYLGSAVLDVKSGDNLVHNGSRWTVEHHNIMVTSVMGHLPDIVQNDTIQYKAYSDSTGNYLISYRYNPDFADIPATYPPGKPHYDAVVTVLEINGSDTTQVYQPLRGVYVQGECTCYDPAKIVDRHKKLNNAEQ